MSNLQVRKDIAVKFFKWTELSDGMMQEPDENNEGYGLGRYQLEDLPAYEEDMTEAWKVISYMQDDYWGYTINRGWPLSSMGRGVTVVFYQGVYPPSFAPNRDDPKYGHWANEWDDDDENVNTALAICRASLLAKEAHASESKT